MTVVLLTTDGESGRIAARYLAQRLPGLAAIVEQAPSRSLLLRRRIKRLGIVRVGGQLAFMAFQRIFKGDLNPRVLIQQPRVIASGGVGESNTEVINPIQPAGERLPGWHRHNHADLSPF